MAPTPVQMWKCSVTGKLFDTPEEAKKCARAEKSRKTRQENRKKRQQELKEVIEYQSNFIRLNATSIYVIPQMIKDKAKEFWEVDVEAEFSDIHFHIIQNKPQWRLKMVIYGSPLKEKQIKKLKGLGFGLPVPNSSIYPLLFGSDLLGGNPAGFLGIRHFSGNSGKLGGTHLAGEALISLSDFPLIQQKYEQYLPLKEAINTYHRQIADFSRVSYSFAERTEAVCNQREVVNELNEKLKDEQEVLSRLISESSSEFVNFCIGKLEKPKDIPFDLRILFS